MTQLDLLEQNVDLIAAAGRLLGEKPRRRFEAEVIEDAQDALKLSLQTMGVDRVDVFVDGRPRETLDVAAGPHAESLTVDGPSPQLVELHGYREGELVAGRKLRFGDT